MLASSDFKHTIQIGLSMLVVIFAVGSAMADEKTDEQSGRQQTAALIDVDDKDSSSGISDPSRADQVQQLIKQLGSESFAQRQSAIEQLWQMGPKVAGPLRQVLGNPDPEVVKRATAILDTFELGIDSSTPRSTALMIMYFENGTHTVREHIINNLKRQKQFLMLFDLLLRVKDIDLRKQLYAQGISLDREIFQLAIKEDWNRIDEILSHEVAWNFDFQLCIYYAQLNGSLDTKIEQLRNLVVRDSEKFDSQSKEIARGTSDLEPEQPVDKLFAFGSRNYQSNLMLLIRLLRVQGHRREAIAYAEKIDNEAAKHELVNRMLMELGDWNSVEAKLPDIDSIVPVQPGQIPVRLAQRALVHHFAGNTEEFNKVIERMIENTKPQPLPRPEASPQADLVDVLLIATDWERAEKYLDRSDRLEMFRLYSLLQRNEAALQSIELTDDSNQRIIWFQRLANQLASVFNQYRRASSDNGVNRRVNKLIGLPSIHEDKAYKRADSIFSLGMTAASQLETLGFTDEAVLHLRTLADTVDSIDPGSRVKRIAIVSALIDMEQYQQVWEVIEQRFNETEYPGLVRYLFPNKSSHAEYWAKHVVEFYPDKLEQLKAVASIVNSPLQTEEIQVELDRVIALVDGSLTSTSQQLRARTNYEIAMACFFHGQFERSRQHLILSSDERYTRAEDFLANLCYETEDFQQAALIFDRIWKRNGTGKTFAAAAAANCYRRLGNQEEAVQRNLAAYATWLESYRTDTIRSQFVQRQKQQRLAPMLNVSVHATTSASLTNEYYRYALADAELDAAPEDSVRNWRIFLFNRLANSTPSGRRFVANWAGQLKLAEATVALKSGDGAAAAEILKEYNRFRPGDSEIGEKLIPLFDELGLQAQADDLFEQVSSYYAHTLGRFPDSPLHHNNYAWLCATSKRRLDFVQYHSDLAVEMRPGNSSYLDTRAEVYFLNGDEQKARELSRKCLQIQPSKLHYQQQFLRFGGKL